MTDKPKESNLIPDDYLRNFPSNQKEEQKPKTTKRVVKKAAKKTKKSRLQKVANIFIGDDPGSLGDYIFYEVLVPAIKNTVSEAVTSGIEILLFGGERSANNIKRTRGESYISYANSGRGRTARSFRFNGRSERSTFSYDNLVFSTRSEAENVLSHLSDMLSEYNMPVSVADFYEASGVEPNFTDHNFGWDTLRGSRIQRKRDGWVILLPDPIDITE